MGALVPCEIKNKYVHYRFMPIGHRYPYWCVVFDFSANTLSPCAKRTVNFPHGQPFGYLRVSRLRTKHSRHAIALSLSFNHAFRFRLIEVELALTPDVIVHIHTYACDEPDTLSEWAVSYPD